MLIRGYHRCFTEVIGFNVETTKTSNVGMSSFILEGLKLKKGWVHGYRVRVETAGCTVALQIWSPDVGNKYSLKGQTIFTAAHTGTFTVCWLNQDPLRYVQLN